MPWEARISGTICLNNFLLPASRILEIVDNSVLVTSLKLRQRIGSKNYVTFTGNVAFRNDNFFDIWGAKPVWGGSVGYGYDSLFGPLEASLG